MRRTRLLALFLDVLVCAGIADGVGLALTALAWRLWPAGRVAIPWLWGALAAGAVLGFLLRDVRGGRARRWLALEVQRADGGPPGAWRSIARNAVLLCPAGTSGTPGRRCGTGGAARCDRTLGLRILRITWGWMAKTARRRRNA
jgi:hypothetical protein